MQGPGQTVLVTGVSSGIGAALARHLLAAGHRVVGTTRRDLTPEDLGIADGTDRFHLVELDLASTESIVRFLEAARGFPTPDVVVLNAGVHIPYRSEMTPEGVEIHEQVNFRAGAAIAVALALRHPRMRIVHVGSNAHRMARRRLRIGTGFWWRYAVSKYRATVFFFALSRCRPDAPVTTVSPGSVATDVHRHKAPWIRRLNESRGIYISPDVAASELADVVLDGHPPGHVLHRGEPTGETYFRELDAGIADIWEPVGDLLHAMGVDAEMVLDHACVVGRLGLLEHHPDTVEGVADLVTGPLTVRGSRHSYNDCFVGRRSVSMDAFATPATVDAATGTATVGAGRTVFDLVADLERQGWTLRYSGNHGAQTIAGATSTGTHGYWRQGGVVAEQITGLDLVDGRGEHRSVTDAEELAATRVGLGLFGVITSMTLAVVPRGDPVRYRIRRMDRARFLDELPSLATAHEYLRFFEPHAEGDQLAFLTIDPAPGEPIESGVSFIEGEVPIPRSVVSTLRSAVHGRPGAMLIPHVPIEADVVVPFGADLFVKAGLAGRAPTLTRAAYTVLNDDRTMNMEIAVPTPSVTGFLGELAAMRTEASRQRGFRCYWTARFCGANDAVLLAANHNRDVHFIDVHVARESPGGSEFLQELQAVAVSRHGAALHWGKMLFGGPDELFANHDPIAVDRFMDVRAEFDPDGRFVNGFARRHLGL